MLRDSTVSHDTGEEKHQAVRKRRRMRNKDRGKAMKKHVKERQRKRVRRTML